MATVNVRKVESPHRIIVKVVDREGQLLAEVADPLFSPTCGEGISIAGENLGRVTDINHDYTDDLQVMTVWTNKSLLEITEG